MHDIAHLKWNHVETPILLAAWIICIVLAKIGFHHSQTLRKMFPESAILIVLGLIAGYFIYEVWDIDLYLHPDLFFLYLLPPIVLDAGYFMPSDAFFENIGTITLFAVFGTLFNICLISATVIATAPFFAVTMNYIDIIIFGTLISAVDPVAVLSVFEEVHVNKILYICVFGESLLNDAVTIVLYNSFHSMVRIGQAHLIYQDFTETMFNFLLVSGGGVLIGFVFTVFTSLFTKWSSNSPILQPLICLTMPYMSYLVSELVHVSGILAIVTCGLFMKNYVVGSMTEESEITVHYFLKTLSSCCEAIIFVFLGFSIFSKNHQWDLAFTISAVFACIMSRFIAVFMLSWLANKKRVKKIGIRDQIIMAFGGLRGAICFGLVLTLDSDSIEAKPFLVSTTLVVIAVTVFIQGTLIKPLVLLLHVETEEEMHRTMTQRVVVESLGDIMRGVEAVVGNHGHNYWEEQVSRLNHRFVQPALARKEATRGIKLVEEMAMLATEEQRQSLLDNHDPDV